MDVNGNEYLCGPPPILKNTTARDAVINIADTRITDKNTEICATFCSFPFWVVCVQEFKKAEHFMTHEDAQSQPGLLILLVAEPADQFKTFRAIGHRMELIHADNILFLSHIHVLL